MPAKINTGVNHNDDLQVDDFLFITYSIIQDIISSEM